MEEPDIYLGAQLSKMTNSDGQECWGISYEKYCMETVNILEYLFGKFWFKVDTKVCYPSNLSNSTNN